jgi:SsrA-binding protein
MNNISIKNRKASFEYHLLDKYIAGIRLTGTEIKSIRDGKASIAEAYCIFINDELWVKNMHIDEYSKGSYNNHDPRRDRKLLLNRQELNKLSRKMDKGLTIIPTHLFIADNGFAKLEIALAQGKKLYDKREDIKKKETTRDLDRRMKSR